MTSRNAPCPCGSGLKFKRCCINKKKRTLSVTADMGAPKQVDSVAIDTKTGTVQFINKGEVVTPKSASASISHERMKGEKIIARSELSPNSIQVNAGDILSRLDIAFAIDTNTKLINGEKISVTSVVSLKIIQRLDESKSLVGFTKVICLELRGLRGDAERVGWVQVIEAIQRTPEYARLKHIGLIVDAHLGLIPKINSRTEPVHHETFLPPNMKLIYASADKKNDSVLNQGLSLADKQATLVLDKICWSDFEESHYRVDDQPFTHLRPWYAAT